MPHPYLAGIRNANDLKLEFHVYFAAPGCLEEAQQRPDEPYLGRIIQMAAGNEDEMNEVGLVVPTILGCSPDADKVFVEIVSKYPERQQLPILDMTTITRNFSADYCEALDRWRRAINLAVEDINEDLGDMGYDEHMSAHDLELKIMGDWNEDGSVKVICTHIVACPLDPHPAIGEDNMIEANLLDDRDLGKMASDLRQQIIDLAQRSDDSHR